MNMKIKKSLHITGLTLLLVLLFCLTAQAADAASYKRADLIYSDEELKVKVEDCYLWLSLDADVLYSSESQSGEVREVFNSFEENCYIVGTNVVTNGSKIYFTANPGNEEDAAIIYCCNTNGTGLEKIKTLKKTESEISSGIYPSIELVSLYKGNLYYMKRNPLDVSQSALYSVNLESGKVSRRAKNSYVEWASGGGRYIYLRKYNGGGYTDTTLRAYDCKTKKFYTVTSTKGAGAIGTYDGKLYYYKHVTAEGESGKTLKVYRCTLSGKEDKLVFSLKDGLASRRVGSKLYCVSNGDQYNNYYYNLKTKKLVSISQDDADAVIGGWNNAGAN